MSEIVNEYFFKEGCYIQEWLNDSENPDMSVARVRVEPGQTTQLHSLKNTCERYVILSGQAIVTVGDKTWQVAVNDVVSIQADQAQKIQNNKNQDLVFLAICTPRFNPENYVALEVQN